MHTHTNTHRKLGLGIFFSFFFKKREIQRWIFLVEDSDSGSRTRALSPKPWAFWWWVGQGHPSHSLHPCTRLSVRSNWRDGAVRRRWRTGDVNCFPVSFGLPCLFVAVAHITLCSHYRGCRFFFCVEGTFPAIATSFSTPDQFGKDF